MTRYRRLGAPGLREYRRGPRVSPHRVPPQLEALILRLREERQYGVKRLSMFLARYHQVYVSPPTMPPPMSRGHHLTAASTTATNQIQLTSDRHPGLLARRPGGPGSCSGKVGGWAEEEGALAIG